MRIVPEPLEALFSAVELSQLQALRDVVRRRDGRALYGWLSDEVYTDRYDHETPKRILFPGEEVPPGHRTWKLLDSALTFPAAAFRENRFIFPFALAVPDADELTYVVVAHHAPLRDAPDCRSRVLADVQYEVVSEPGWDSMGHTDEEGNRYLHVVLADGRQGYCDLGDMLSSMESFLVLRREGSTLRITSLVDGHVTFDDQARRPVGPYAW